LRLPEGFEYKKVPFSLTDYLNAKEGKGGNVKDAKEYPKNKNPKIV